jgi:hypothetical protein
MDQLKCHCPYCGEYYIVEDPIFNVPGDPGACGSCQKTREAVEEKHKKEKEREERRYYNETNRIRNCDDD